VHEHLVPVLYFLQVHLLYATLVALGAWALTSLRGASVTAKFWICTAASLNFVVPLGGFIDRFGAQELPGAQQLAPIAALDLALARHPSVAALLGALWVAGALLMLLRLLVRISRERRTNGGHRSRDAPAFRVQGVPVHFTAGCQGPAVEGILRSHICLPVGIQHLLSERELHAVLLHEVTHARRRDNLLRLIHELAQCLLWFHPLLWLTGSRLALYRELSCDASVLKGSSGSLLVSALAKLTSPENGLVLSSAATSFVAHRLDRLLAPATAEANRRLNAALVAAFATLLCAAVFLTVANTACCLVPVP
jgi:beta-lactamase regulating signal transducer with metallopeptidase domain